MRGQEPHSSRGCHGAPLFTRRGFLQVGGLGALGLTLGDWWALSASAARPGPDRAAKAKAVIVLWLWGGPSHLDTFDPKPDAPLEYRGPFEPIATSVPGVQVCELFPQLARQTHRYSIVRSMHHTSNDHGVAGTIALTGSISGAIDLGGKAAGGAARPSTGAIVGRLRGRPAETRSSSLAALPPYVILGNELHQGHKRVIGEGGGTLGGAYDPFRLDYEPGHGLKVPNIDLPQGVSTDRLEGRWNLLGGLDQASANGPDAPPGRMSRHYELAYRLIAAKSSLEALDINREPARVREAYGPHRFGQCCLSARRLVEAGVPFVQVNWSTHVEGPEDAGDGGWDMHDRYFQIQQDRHGWMLDRAMSALLDDLHDRGLLETTLVLAVGEFGRTPKINDKAGRDHWNLCYSALAAGGGIAGGRVIGASDRRGEHPIDQPATPADLGATVLEALGIGSAELTSVGLTPLGQPISELFA